ncbi:unnamed protein product, partial [Ixodes pacificus]
RRFGASHERPGTSNLCELSRGLCPGRRLWRRLWWPRFRGWLRRRLRRRSRRRLWRWLRWTRRIRKQRALLRQGSRWIWRWVRRLGSRQRAHLLREHRAVRAENPQRLPRQTRLNSRKQIETCSHQRKLKKQSGISFVGSRLTGNTEMARVRRSRWFYFQTKTSTQRLRFTA